jgi:hypothetical protein
MCSSLWRYCLDVSGFYGCRNTTLRADVLLGERCTDRQKKKKKNRQTLCQDTHFGVYFKSYLLQLAAWTASTYLTFILEEPRSNPLQCDTGVFINQFLLTKILKIDPGRLRSVIVHNLALAWYFEAQYLNS